jgi:hypothetical protein
MRGTQELRSLDFRAGRVLKERLAKFDASPRAVEIGRWR